ncbi:hypothetical protein ROSA5918_25245 [Roseateles saccharophilus]|uniref:Uncharacterized protein n=1 Tax=Roseateles saccharophilus TaxID=304 RepID=A0A4R3UVF1_ROSSA|nr:hypothetical protein EV671_10143 [Roseateles saccharophilus]
MWNALVRWCGLRHSEGHPIREVSLPQPGPGKHIGLSNAIAFPNWRAIKALRTDFDSSPRLLRASKGPKETALDICPLIIDERGYRPEMVMAARSFRQLYDCGTSLLELHRFWPVVCRAARHSQPRKKAELVLARIELVSGALVSDVRLYVAMVDRDGTEVQATCPPFTESVDETARRLHAWGGEPALRLRRMFDAGAVPFLPERFGVWTASSIPPCDGQLHRYLIHARHLSSIPAAIRPSLAAVGGAWYHLGPVAAKDALLIHGALNIEAPSAVVVRPLQIEFGVRTRAGWLGRPSVLPSVRRRGSGAVTLRPASEHARALVTAKESLGGMHRLVAESPVDGLYRIRLQESLTGGEALAVELPVRFVGDAPAHASIPPTPSAWCTDPECVQEAWIVAGQVNLRVDDEAAVHPEPFDDLLEVIYALGRAGWSERELVQTVRELCPGPSPWEVLRSLHEAGWLERVVHEGWRAVGWRLVPPRIVRMLTDGGDVALLTGSASAAIRRRFQLTASAMGGRVVARAGLGPFSVASMCATNVDVTQLSTNLGWPVGDALIASLVSAPRCWPTRKLTTAGFHVHREWDWRAGGFSQASSSSGVRLLWYRRQEADRHDVYAVEGRGQAFLTSSRTSAVAEAHRRAGKPLFQPIGDILLCCALEGHLPLHFARTAYIGALRAPGPVMHKGAWRYAYSSSAVPGLVVALGRAFVAVLDRPAEVSAGITVADFGRARHRLDGWSRASIAMK